VTIVEEGLVRLLALTPRDDTSEIFLQKLANLREQFAEPEDPPCWLVCVLALEALNSGNFGVGSLITDDSGQVVALGSNAVFHPHFRSDAHAEMLAVDQFESGALDRSLSKHILFTSLESCPMCLARMITAGVGEIVHVCSDHAGGMVHKLNDMPPIWRDLARGIVMRRAQCSNQYVHLADAIFRSKAAARNEELRSRRKLNGR
jgi:cytosine deaminase